MLCFQEIFVLWWLIKYGICCSKMEISLSFWYLTSFYLSIEKLFFLSISVLNISLKFLPFRASCPSLKYQIKNDYLKISKTLLAGRSNRKDHVNKGRENERKSGVSQPSLLRNLHSGLILFHDKKEWNCAACAWNVKTNVKNGWISSAVGASIYLPVILKIWKISF